MQKTICDICGDDAVATMKFSTSETTEIAKDLCQKHLEQIKKILNRFINGNKEETSQ